MSLDDLIAAMTRHGVLNPERLLRTREETARMRQMLDSLYLHQADAAPYEGRFTHLPIKTLSDIANEGMTGPVVEGEVIFREWLDG